PLIARWLNLAEKPHRINKMRNFDVDFSNEIKSVTTEIEITSKILEKGNKIMNLPLPEHTLVVMVRREENYFVPTGQTILKEKDKILIITDNHEALTETYKNIGVENV
ncbi:MAG TPA: TrkA C-terminal domain-containing protein, partial [Bacteroidales bacterium]|nr:TrkA C-terminal domain-containing protein [Bacteroidales bacterium]